MSQEKGFSRVFPFLAFVEGNRSSVNCIGNLEFHFLLACGIFFRRLLQFGKERNGRMAATTVVTERREEDDEFEDAVSVSPAAGLRQRRPRTLSDDPGLAAWDAGDDDFVKLERSDSSVSLEDERERSRKRHRRRRSLQVMAEQLRERMNREILRSKNVMEFMNLEFKEMRERMRKRKDKELLVVKERAKSVWKRVKSFAQLIAFAAPPLYGVNVVLREHPWVLLYVAIYSFMVFGFIVYVFILPSMNHPGVSLFKPYDLPASEEAKLNKIIDAAQARLQKMKKRQGYWTEEEKEKPLFILSLDGGGIRGAMTARILSRILDEFPEFMDRVDLIGGCSTGTIVGGMLASAVLPHESLEVIKITAPVVFRSTLWQQLMQFGMIGGPGHDGEGKFTAIRSVLRGLRLGELWKGICFTTCHVEGDQCAPRIWTNVVDHASVPFRGHHDLPELSTGHVDEEMYELLMSRMADIPVENMDVAEIVNGATAAPIYFPAFKGMVDGGLWSNDPSMAALSMSLRQRDVENIFMLSISTGTPRPDLSCKVDRWGLSQWLPYLVDFLFNSTSKASEFNCRSILNDRYLRIDPTLDRPIVLNDVNAIDELVRTADKTDLEPTFRFLENKLGLKRKDYVDDFE